MEEIQGKKFRKFSIREFGGSLGDWGTLIPFMIGYISIVGLNPAGMFLCLGITNIVLGIRYNLPLPVQPQKTIGTVALANNWTPTLVISTGFGTGIVWTVLGFSKKLNAIVKKVPIISVRGIQLGLAFILGWASILLLLDNLILGFIAIGIILLLMKSKHVPSAIILMFLGIFLVFINGQVSLSNLIFNIPRIDFYIPDFINLVIGMVLAGFAQLFLTLTNVMIATVALIRDLFPESKVDANSLSFNMGLINLVNPFFGGIPLCHGSGGLAAQYAFGARTGGSMILEGLMEIIFGLFFSQSILMLFTNFPQAILGAMLFYTAILLGKVSFKDFNKKKFPIILISAIFCFMFNVLIGFLIGILLLIIYNKIVNDKE
ncbi:MAG: putative sulfate/molybdate transporter [Promethearchaeota archaeon]